MLNNLLQAYPKNVTVLRTYANFLETIKQDKETAELMYAEADSHEEENTRVYDVVSIKGEEKIEEMGDPNAKSSSGLPQSNVPESAMDMNSRISSGIVRQHGNKNQN